MSYLPDLDFINAFITNLAIIIASILSYYFITLYVTTHNKRTHLSFVTANFLSQAKLSTTILLGFLLGAISFVLSLNRIPLPNSIFSVDMRYVFIFFSVVYGSELLGSISMLSLVGLKELAYLMANDGLRGADHFNNIALSLILLVFSILLQRQNVTLIKKSLIFITFFLGTRYLFAVFYLKPFFELDKQAFFILYASIFSAIFLVATLIIEIAISISRSVHVYRTAAIYDSLTTVFNKESFNFFLDYVANLTAKDTQQLSLAVLDIDNFKDVNDKYGHPVGDQVLRYLGQQLKALETEQTHYICRIGGDEFAIIHNESPLEAQHYYDSLMAHLRRKELKLDNDPYQLSVSVGLTHFKLNKDFSPQRALEAADSALYQAKAQGKNQVIVTWHEAT